MDYRSSIWNRPTRRNHKDNKSIIYEETDFNVKIGTETTQTFKVKTRVGQGCIISPLLFSTIFDYLLSEQDGKGFGIQVNEKCIFDPDFADDMALFATSNEELQNNRTILINIQSKQKILCHRPNHSNLG